MKVTLLGTGTSGGVPMIGCRCVVCRSEDPRDKRMRSACLVEDGARRILIDCGPDFRQQMLGADIGDLDGILFTHEHRDHTAGLDDIRAINFLQQKAMPIYATAAVMDSLRRQYDYFFEPGAYKGGAKLTLHEIGKDPFELAGVPIQPIEVMHHELPVLGFRFGDFAYVTDASAISPEAMDQLRDCQVLVINALRQHKHISHFTLEEALAILRELKPAQAYLTHIGHQMGLHQVVDEDLPDGVHLGYDGLNLYI